MSNPVLSVQNLDIAYGDLKVVHDFSLDVHAGEFVSLLGPSGCGKTTILRAIAGFIGSAAGKIVLNGEDITAEPAERRDVGIVFQNYALFPTMTAFENIAFGLRVAKESNAEVERRVTEIARASGIEEQLQKRPSDMSGGQQQRVAIARALVTGAQVLLFDEPLSNLDSKVRVSMRREIKRLQEKFGFTAFFVTHDQDEALSMSDRIVVLKDGHTQQIGSGRELYTEPSNEFVCQFIGQTNAIAAAQSAHLLGEALQTESYVRPEDMLVSRQSDGGNAATVAHIEYLGAQVVIEFTLDNKTYTSALYGHDVPAGLQVGDQIYVSVRTGCFHTFARPTT